MIVSNISAALEYEERTRQGTWGSTASLPGVEGGLPPPPRPRSSRGRLARAMAMSPSNKSSMSVPTSPMSSSMQLAEGERAPSNPYINPVPRLSYLLREEPPLLVVGGRPSSPDGVSIAEELSNDTHSIASVQPHSADSHGSQPSSASPSSPKETNRHHRGLSSLHKVEKMLGKSKSALGMLAESNLRSKRRSSDADVPQSGGTEKPSIDALMRPYRRVLERGKAAADAPSAPSSPVTTTSAETSRARRVAVGSSAHAPSRAMKPPAVAADTQSPLSHARQDSDMSAASTHSLSPSSDTTHDPPSSCTEQRISISSTLYTSRQHSFDITPYPVGRSTNMSDDRVSFIDMASPTLTPSHSHDFASMIPIHYSVTPESRVSPQSYTSEESNYYPNSAKKPLLPRLTTTGKPPIPTAPKPKFRRSRSAQPPPEREAVAPHGGKEVNPLDNFTPDMERGLRNIPSTTNLLDPQIRADRIRKTKKLTQLFGQIPGVSPEPIDVALANSCLPVSGGLGVTAPSFMKRKHKQAASMLDDPIVPVYGSQKRAVWPPHDDVQHIYLGDRRRSVPFTPQDFSSISGLSYTDDGHSILTISKDASHVIEIGSQEGVPSSDWDSHTGHAPQETPPPDSPTSFIDLSDEEGPSEALPGPRSAETPKFQSTSRAYFSPSTPSLHSSLSPEQQAEEERRRKREKLAKLHRFLGSRVPPHLVLGPLEEGVPLPPPAPTPPLLETMYEEEADARKARMRRRRSSSAAEFAGTWSDEIDRLKEDLNDREKAINVRRAVKMEKMFGEAPPQKLYHTRQAVSSPGSSASPATGKPWQAPRSPTHTPKSPSGSGPRNLNQTSYKGKSKKGRRPGTADSDRPLLSPSNDDDQRLSAPLSDVYLHYRQSLNSLNHIIDQDDKQSLAELHDYLSGDRNEESDKSPYYDDGFVATSPTSTKAERRRSLPSRMSMASVTSEWSLMLSPPPEESTFQARRRRAAKLTQFFGVNYRDLMIEILDSIEKGLEEERGKGTLKPDEIQDLMRKLVKLKTKRHNFS